MNQEPFLVHFLLLPDFPLYGLVPATEALRIANQNAGVALYDWRFVSAAGGSVRAGNGISIEPTLAIGGAALPDLLIVCGGNEPTQHLTRPLLAWLRRLAAHGTTLGALDTGAFALAEAGVIRDRLVTLHWEAIPVFHDAYPAIGVTEQVFVIDRGLATAAGGIASLDLMLALITRAHGPRLAQVVTDAFIHGQPRRAEMPQRNDARNGPDEHALYHRAIRLMHEHVAYRLPVNEICSILQISRRRLERTFLKQAGRSPAAAYLDIRLQVARDQLFYSSNPIVHVAEVTGFESNAHFCRAFRRKYGAPPTVIRRMFQGDERSKFYPRDVRLVESLPERQPVPRRG